MTQEKIDGHEAYRDDPEYTSPEMLPIHGSDEAVTGTPDLAAISAAGMSIGAGGGAMAGQVLRDEIDEEIAETSVHHGHPTT